VKGLAELSLVLSIPKQPTEFDDGLLTASEVAQFGGSHAALDIDVRPAEGRSQTRPMLAYLNDASSPRNAYPVFWGPFALIGEGAAR